MTDRQSVLNLYIVGTLSIFPFFQDSRLLEVILCLALFKQWMVKRY